MHQILPTDNYRMTLHQIEIMGMKSGKTLDRMQTQHYKIYPQHTANTQTNKHYNLTVGI